MPTGTLSAEPSQRFDVDQDGALAPKELEAYCVACNGAPLPQDELDEIANAFSLDARGNLTLRGFMEMYSLQTEARPMDTWSDLRKLGYGLDLQLETSEASQSTEDGIKQADRDKQLPLLPPTAEMAAAPASRVPEKEELLLLLSQLKVAHPEFGAGRLREAALSAQPTWSISDKRVKSLASEIAEIVSTAATGSAAVPSGEGGPPPAEGARAPHAAAQRIIPVDAPTCSWEAIQIYGARQAEEAEAGRGPRRTEGIEERYRRYKQWCAERGHTGVELVSATAIWLTAAPCGAVDGAGGARVALEVNIVPYHLDAGISHWVLWYHPDSTPGDADLDGSFFAAHVRLFLPSLRVEDELVAFQNLPQYRSVP